MEEAAERGGRFPSDERLLEIFDPDIVLPAQHFAAIARKKFPSGEHRLLVALIQDAIECFQKHMHARDAKRRQLFLDAQGWIGAEDDHSVFSFNNVCMLLGMNPQYLREGLSNWSENARKVGRSERRRPSRRRNTVRIVPAQAAAPAETQAGDSLP